MPEANHQNMPAVKDRFFNCHAHCFTMDHVPSFFFNRLIPIGWILNREWVKRMIKDGPVTGQLPFGIRVLLFILWVCRVITRKEFKRLLTMVRFGNTNDQRKVIEAIRQYYPEDTGYVFLTMDMAYIGAGKAKESYQVQLEKLAELKTQVFPGELESRYRNLIYPFLFVDPRRVQPLGEREENVDKHFIGDVFIAKMREYINNGSFQGLKIYPALGYYPFDKRMKVAYDLAKDLELPIMTHCTMGVVHHKYQISEELAMHPIKGALPELAPSKYQAFFSHPLNYECLLNQRLLSKIWGSDAPDYRDLKICIGHWGSEEDWHRYLDNDWADIYERVKGQPCPALDLDNWHVDEAKSHLNFTWFTIVYELIKSNDYPNLYADISYTLEDASLLPMLKIMLESDPKVKEHVLFGTDFFLVNKAVSERQFSINIRAALGEELFHQIATVNARRFISNKHNPVH